MLGSEWLTNVMIIDVCVSVVFFFFLKIRQPPRSTQSRSSAASDVYKRQAPCFDADWTEFYPGSAAISGAGAGRFLGRMVRPPVSYTHLRAHETVLDLVCRLLLEKKNENKTT